MLILGPLVERASFSVLVTGMQTNEIAERISRVLETRLRVDPGRITEIANFDEDLSATSLDMAETIMSLEDEFGVEISDRDAHKLQTVGDVIALIRAKLT